MRLLTPSRSMQVEFGHPLQSVDELQTGSNGRTQFISTSYNSWLEIAEANLPAHQLPRGKVDGGEEFFWVMFFVHHNYILLSDQLS